jgi:hypothetical protein
VQQAAANLTAQGGGSGSRAALIIAIIAMLGAVVALLRGFNVF